MDTGVATLQAMLTGRAEEYGARERTASTPVLQQVVDKYGQVTVGI